jgi:glycosyltransferase involved in cell wall biosynthesis
MHVLVVSCVYPPEPVVSAQTSAQIAAALAQKGHRVTVIAPVPSRPAGVRYPGYARRLYQRSKTSSGCDLVHCASIPSRRSTMIGRFVENLSFGLTGSWAVWTGPRPDVIYGNTWPLFATGLLAIVAWLRHVPTVISVQDVYPESLVAQQRRRISRLAVRALSRLDGLIARSARAVVVISERFARLYREGRKVSPARLHVVPNWVDGAPFETASRGEAPSSGEDAGIRLKLSIPSHAFVVAYGGNLSVASGVETLVRAVRQLSDHEDIYALIAGAGSQLEACKALARDMPPGRVIFYSPWPAEETVPVLRAADLLVLPTRGEQSLASVPSKLISYMLAARPVLALALPRSDLAALVERSGCGWVVAPDRPEQLAQHIQRVAGLAPAERRRRGQAGHDFARQHMTREVILPRLIDIVERAPYA